MLDLMMSISGSGGCNMVLIVKHQVFKTRQEASSQSLETRRRFLSGSIGGQPYQELY